MRIVIDMQGAQSKSSGSRGVGRYALNMTKALIEAMPEAEFFLALNGKLPTECVMAFFEGILPRENIKTWTYYPHIPKGSTFEKQGGRPEEFFREWFLHQFKADIIWIPNLQEGEGETEIATSAKLTRGREAVVTTLHDISPILLNKDIIGPQGNLWYKQKIIYAGNCDLILTVSDFSQEQIRKLKEVSCDVKVAYNGYDRKHFYPDEMRMSPESKESYFLYCGGLDHHKNVKRLVEALSLMKNKKHDLLIAGKNPPAIEKALEKYANSLGLEDRVKILGFVTDEKLANLMQRCRAFVMSSYAEGFGLPALEAMACGAPTLVSDATSLKEIVRNEEARFDPTSAEEMAARMDRVIEDRKFAQMLIDDGIRDAVSFSWERGAQSIKEAFEALPPVKGIVEYGIDDLCEDLRPWIKDSPAFAGEIARSIEDSKLFRQERNIYIDASAVVLEDYLTGIQRVVYGYAEAIIYLCKDHQDKKVKVIYSTPDCPCFYEVVVNEEGKYKRNHKACESNAIEFHDGDILLMPDLHPGNVIAKREYLKRLSERGVKVFTMLHDTIASTYAEFFNDDVVREFEGYLEAVAEFSGVIGNSNATLKSYIDWCKTRKIIFPPYYVMDYNHLGVDFSKRDHVKGEIPSSGKRLLEIMGENPTVLMVATLEPRKMHKQVLSAMEILWDKGMDVNLVFVGRQGWKTEKLVYRINNHPQNGRKLYWLSGISDAYLKAVYEAASGVVVASIVEGYGLPIIEAAHYGKPLLLRDIPVFREVAEDNAAYFEGEDAESLAEAMEKWIKDIGEGRAIDSMEIEALSWEECARGILMKMDSKFFTPDEICKDNFREARLQSLYDSFLMDNEADKERKWGGQAVFFENCKNVLDLSDCVGAEAVKRLKNELNLEGIYHANINTVPVTDIIKFCQEAYYRLSRGAYFVVKVKKYGLINKKDKRISAEILKEIMENVGFSDIEMRCDNENTFELPFLHCETIGNLEEFNNKIRELNALLNPCEYILACRKEA